MNLSKTSTKDLIAELTKREELGKIDKFAHELQTIKTRIKAKKLICACEYYQESYPDFEEGNRVEKKVWNYVLGIIKDGDFKDYYYNSDMEYEEFQKLIPSCF